MCASLKGIARFSPCDISWQVLAWSWQIYFCEFSKAGTSFLKKHIFFYVIYLKQYKCTKFTQNCNFVEKFLQIFAPINNNRGEPLLKNYWDEFRFLNAILSLITRPAINSKVAVSKSHSFLTINIFLWEYVKAHNN